MSSREFAELIRADQRIGKPSERLIRYVLHSATLYCSARGQNHADAADIAQNVAIKIVNKFNIIDCDRSPARYLSAICRTERWKFIRRACNYARAVDTYRKTQQTSND